MGKKQKTEKRKAKAQPSGLLEGLGRQLDQLPEMQLAAKTLQEARADVREVLRRYRRLRRKLRRRMKKAQGGGVKELLGDPLGYIERQPLRGLCVVGLLGLIVGWLLGRREDEDRR